MSRVDQLPAGTRASILRTVIAEKFPRTALASIASRYGIQFDDLRVIIEKAGYPDKDRMAAFAVELDEQEANNLATAVTTATAVASFDEAVVAALAATDAPTSHLALVKDDDTERLLLVPIADLHPDPDNPRELPHIDDTDIVELAESMAEAGLVQPIVARRADGGRLVVVAGHRRLTAARRLRWTTVKTIVRGPMPPDQVIAAMLIENGQRKDLDPISEARGLAFLQTQMGGCTDVQLAQRVGRSPAHVGGRLALLSLSAEDQAAVRAGTMSLAEGQHHGRLNSGRVGAKGVTRGWHLGPSHSLGTRAKARCQRLDHSRARTVGGMACGECWETVIRADERAHLHEINARMGECVTCGQPVEQVTSPAMAGANP